MLEHEEALVLKTEPSGESFIKLYVLSVESGIFLCMKRISKKANSSTIPDLFDTAVILLEASQQGTMRFVKGINSSSAATSLAKTIAACEVPHD